MGHIDGPMYVDRATHQQRWEITLYLEIHQVRKIQTIIDAEHAPLNHLTYGDYQIFGMHMLLEWACHDSVKQLESWRIRHCMLLRIEFDVSIEDAKNILAQWKAWKTHRLLCETQRIPRNSRPFRSSFTVRFPNFPRTFHHADSPRDQETDGREKEATWQFGASSTAPADRVVKRTWRDWLTAWEMLMLFNLSPTRDETDRAVGLSGWWSKRRGYWCKGRLCVCVMALNVEIDGIFLLAVFLIFTHLQSFSVFVRSADRKRTTLSEKLRAGKYNVVHLTWDCGFAHGTSVHARVMKECVVRMWWKVRDLKRGAYVDCWCVMCAGLWREPFGIRQLWAHLLNPSATPEDDGHEVAR